jgi:hypothetical protein
MAFIDVLPNNPDVSRYANVTMAVGRGAPNRRADVQLVQYMLRELFRNPTEQDPPLIPPEERVYVDGRFGPNTRKGIIKFQLNLFSQQGRIALDARVDRARHRGISSISQTTYTILWMNYLYKLARPDEFETLLAGDIPDMPSELASELQSSRLALAE